MPYKSRVNQVVILREDCPSFAIFAQLSYRLLYMEDLRGRILPGFDTGRTVGKEGERGTEMSRHVNSFSPDLFTSSFLHFHDTPKDLSELLKETTVNGPAGDH